MDHLSWAAVAFLGGAAVGVLVGRLRRVTGVRFPTDREVDEVIRQMMPKISDVSQHLRPKVLRAHVWRRLHEMGFRYWPYDLEKRIHGMLP